MASQESGASLEAVRELVSALRRAAALPKKYVQAKEFRVLHHDAASDPGATDSFTVEAGSISAAASRSEHVIVNWKTSEVGFRVATLGSPELPTLARGLFLQDLGDDRWRVAVRGYDKFFSEGEMSWTKAASIEAYSTGPYLLTFKENGCIIFISALSPTELVVTSKNSLGPREDCVAHAVAGQNWLRRHLSAVGRSEGELAAELWRRNETAVAELCDDSFEEHVLGYPPERSGLHLHGLNSNSPDFRTRHMREVDAFAAAWGFMPTRWMEFQTLKELRNLTTRVAETGAWEGEAIEGFVVRTHMPTRGPEHSSDAAVPPYSAGQAWFYKVKFEEPYLMYRQWRENMVGMLNQRRAWDEKRTAAIEKLRSDERNKAEGLAEQMRQQSVKTSETTSTDDTLSKNKLKTLANAQRKAAAKDDKQRNPPRPDVPTTNSKRAESHLFISWCYDRIWGRAQAGIERDAALFKGVLEGHGIIRVRNEFLRYLETPDGLSQLVQLRLKLKETSSADVRRSDARPFRSSGKSRALIVPVAVPGCGKTAICIALRTLYPAPVMAHEQSDDITSKRTAFAFLQNVFEALATHEMVLADRNNHLRSHRKELVQRTATTEHPDPSKKKAADKYKQVRAKAEAKKKQQERSVEADGIEPHTSDGSASEELPRIRMIALAWRIIPPLQRIFDICKQRLVARGDRHQVLRCEGSSSTAEVERILWRMLSDHEEFDTAATAGEEDADHGFDDVVWVDPDADLETNVRSVTASLGELLGLPAPSKEAFVTALEAARSYSPKVRKDLTPIPPPQIRYYAIALEHFDLGSDIVARVCGQDEDASRFYERLKRDGRLGPRPHITLVHNLSLMSGVTDATASETAPLDAANDGSQTQSKGARATARRRWDLYANLAASARPPSFKIRLDRLAWDKRAMALGVSAIELVESEEQAEEQKSHSQGSSEHLRNLLPDAQAEGGHLHVTVGTAGPEIAGFEAHRVLRDADENARGTGAGSEGSEGGVRGGNVQMLTLQSIIEVEGRLKGMY